jgi:hypothetical protein
MQICGEMHTPSTRSSVAYGGHPQTQRLPSAVVWMACCWSIGRAHDGRESGQRRGRDTGHRFDQQCPSYWAPIFSRIAAIGYDLERTVPGHVVDAGLAGRGVAVLCDRMNPGWVLRRAQEAGELRHGHPHPRGHGLEMASVGYSEVVSPSGPRRGMPTRALHRIIDTRSPPRYTHTHVWPPVEKPPVGTRGRTPHQM